MQGAGQLTSHLASKEEVAPDSGSPSMCVTISRLEESIIFL